MAHRVIVSSEMKTLLSAADLAGIEPTWMEPHDPIPGGDFVGLVPLLVRKVRDDDLARLPKLRVIANCAVGYENVDLEAARRRGIPVTNTPGVLTESTADLTMGLILSITRGMASSETLLRGGTWKGWHPAEFLGLELSGATLGIIGAGRIGRAVARRAKGFGLRILYTARNRVAQIEEETGAAFTTLDGLLAESDVVTVHVPSNPSTRGMMDRTRFARMKQGSYFVNTSRGDIVDEDALLNALQSGHLAAAGLDVFRNEPKLDPRLFRAPRLTMLPHIGSATTKTRRAMAALALENVRAVLGGRPPVTPIPMVAAAKP